MPAFVCVEVDNDGFKVYDSGGTLIDPAEDATVQAIVTELQAIKSTTGIKAIIDPLPAGTNNIGDVDLASAIPAGANIIGLIKLVDTAGTNVLAIDSSGRAATNLQQWIGSAAPTVGQKVMASSLPVTIASDHSSIVVTAGTTEGEFLTVSYDKVALFDGAQAGYWLKAASYQVPAGYKFSVGQYNSYSEDNRVSARVAEILTFGTWNPNTGVYTDAASYSTPLFGAFIELEVTTVTGNVDDQAITVGYTNAQGTSGRTATAVGDLKLKKNTPVGFKMLFELQAGDIGVRSIQSVTADKPNTGAVAVNGGIDMYYQRLKEADTSYIVVPGAANPVIGAGGVLSLDISSNGGATVRRLLKCIGVLEAVT